MRLLRPKDGLAMTALMLVVVTACSPERQMNRAQALEKKGKFYEAWQKYQEIAANNPKSSKAPEALFHAGWLAQRQLNDCHMAGVFYDAVVATYPQSDPWAKLAANQVNNCPDYFPLFPGAEWVEGDSDTKGKNARIEIVCKTPPGNDVLLSQAGLIERTYFAGKSKFKTVQATYKKMDGDVQEYTSESELVPKVVFRIPPKVGAHWKTISGKRAFMYEIAAVDKTVKVEAGEFTSCVLVQSRLEGVPGSTNEYYAPSVGKVLTSFATADGEKRNTELLSYKPVQEIDFKSTPKNP